MEHLIAGKKLAGLMPLAERVAASDIVMIAIEGAVLLVIYKSRIARTLQV